SPPSGRRARLKASHHRFTQGPRRGCGGHQQIEERSGSGGRIFRPARGSVSGGGERPGGGVPDHGPCKGDPFKVKLPEDLPIQKVVLADRGKSLDWRARRFRIIWALPWKVKCLDFIHT